MSDDLKCSYSEIGSAPIIIMENIKPVNDEVIITSEIPKSVKLDSLEENNQIPNALSDSEDNPQSPKNERTNSASIDSNDFHKLSKNVDDHDSYSPTSIPDCISTEEDYSTDEAKELEESAVHSPVVATTSEDSSPPKPSPPTYAQHDENPKIDYCHSYSPKSVYDEVGEIYSTETDDKSNKEEGNKPEDSDDDDSVTQIEQSKKFFKHFSNIINLRTTLTKNPEEPEDQLIPQTGFASTPILTQQLPMLENAFFETSPKQASIKSSSEDSFSTLHAWKRKRTNILKDTDSENENENQHKIEYENEKDLEYRFNGKRYCKTTTTITPPMMNENDIPTPIITETESPIKNKAKSKNFISDFDQMQQQKRAEKSKSRNNRNLDFITKNDDLIAELIEQMEEAAYEDRCLNEQGLPAIKKVGMLKYVTSQLIKKDLQQTFLEHNILSTLTEWLSPLPSKCLPCVQIRENILRILADFPTINSILLKESGIGKALMFLRKHPDETKANRERCNRLIAQWARPIHNLTCDYTAMSKRERQERDIELSMRYKKQVSEQPIKSKSAKSSDVLDQALKGVGHEREARPGEPGWVPRARVPQPSTKDYVRRPESQLICPLSSKTKPNRYEVLAKKYQNAAKRCTLSQRSIAGLSVFGNKM